jgi:hypothetical protein
MTNTQEALFWVLATVQIFGIGSCIITRLRECTCSRQVFGGCLALVGIATMLAIYAGSPSWCSSGATLALMCIVATLDFRGEVSTSSF